MLLSTALKHIAELLEKRSKGVFALRTNTLRKPFNCFTKGADVFAKALIESAVEPAADIHREFGRKLRLNGQ